MRSKREISSRRSREMKEIHDMMHRILKICMEQTRTEQAYLLLEISHFIFKSGSINIYGILGRGRVPDLLKLWELSSTVIEKGTKVILPDGNEVVWPPKARKIDEMREKILNCRHKWVAIHLPRVWKELDIPIIRLKCSKCGFWLKSVYATPLNILRYAIRPFAKNPQSLRLETAYELSEILKEVDFKPYIERLIRNADTGVKKKEYQKLMEYYEKALSFLSKLNLSAKCSD